MMIGEGSFGVLWRELLALKKRVNSLIALSGGGSGVTDGDRKSVV